MIFFSIGVGALGLGGYLFSQGKPSLKGAVKSVSIEKVVESKYPAGGLLAVGEGGPSRARNARLGRSPAVDPGSAQETSLKPAVERLLSNDKVAAEYSRLKEFFPETSAMGFWIRAAIAIGTTNSGEELTPEGFETIGKIYAQILSGEENVIAELQAGLEHLPSGEGEVRRQAVRMLSDIGLKNQGLRDAVRTALLAEAGRAGSSPSAALAYSSLLRINPGKDGYREVNRAFEKTHPGVELSDFVALNAAHL